MSLSTLVFIAAMVLMLFMHLRHGGHGGGGHGGGCHGGRQQRPEEDGEASKEDGGDGTA